MNQSRRSLLWSAQGSATVEFAVSSLLFMFLAFATVEYGVLFSERNAVTSLAREGASLASRELTTDANILSLMQSTEGTLALKGHPEKYSIFLAKIVGSTGLGQPPQCTVTPIGTLTDPQIQAPTQAGQCDLPNNLWNYLTWQGPPIDGPGVDQFTVVKVYYQHNPITPVGGMSPFLGGPGHQSPNLIMSTKAIF